MPTGAHVGAVLLELEESFEYLHGLVSGALFWFGSPGRLRGGSRGVGLRVQGAPRR